jgi:hypothetical protein
LAASLPFAAACRECFRAAKSHFTKSFSAGCRKEQAGSLCSQNQKAPQKTLRVRVDLG